MLPGNLPPPQWITSLPQLKQLAEALVRERILGVDTESNSLFAYFERVCLIQISTEDSDLLVDPLAIQDLSALRPVFADPQVEKVFHAAEYDLICLKRDFSFQMANLFDTMAAARILGYDQVGLGALLEAHYGVRVDKRQQRADWGQRPLPAHLVDYARLDTHFLIPLRTLLKEMLLSRGLWPLALEDFNRLAVLEVGENGAAGVTSETACWRIRGAHDLPPHQASVLLELCRYRDQVARQMNRPLFKVIGDHTLLAVARETPRNPEGLRRIPGMTPAQIRRHGEMLLQAVKRGLKSPPVYPPRSPRPDERYLQRLEALRQWRKETARQMGVPSDVVLPRDLLYELAKKDPHTESELADIMQDVPWRLERFGEKMMEVIGRRKR